MDKKLGASGMVILQIEVDTAGQNLKVPTYMLE